jgi:hypothetical protein
MGPLQNACHVPCSDHEEAGVATSDRLQKKCSKKVDQTGPKPDGAVQVVVF